MDAPGLGKAVCYQDGMGDDNKIVLTARELTKGRAEVESKNSSSGLDREVRKERSEAELKCSSSKTDCNVQPSNEEGLSGGIQEKRGCGRPRKGTRLPTKRSERVRIWQEKQGRD